MAPNCLQFSFLDRRYSFPDEISVKLVFASKLCADAAELLDWKEIREKGISGRRGSNLLIVSD